MKKEIEFKSDKFRKNRGGYSRWLLLSCEKCKTPILVYQKDGPGMLKRLYIDRITSPVVARKSLNCNKCKTILGMLVVYEKERRRAYRLFAGAVEKKIVRSKNLKKGLTLGP